MAARVKDTRTIYSGNSDYNMNSAFIRNMIGEIYTAEPVVVVAVYENSGSEGPPGFVNVLPLVSQYDAYNEVIEGVRLNRLPYFRLQAGAAAIVLDPKVGDIGIAVYMKRDSSDISVGQTEPIKPNTFRAFDQSDGFFIGGFYNRQPTVFVELDEAGSINITAPDRVVVNTDSATINSNTATVNAETALIDATQSATIKSPQTTIESAQTVITGQLQVGGNVSIGGGITWEGEATGVSGPARFNGGITNTGGSITTNGITVETHVHGGVQSGGSNTEGPQ